MISAPELRSGDATAASPAKPSGRGWRGEVGRRRSRRRCARWMPSAHRRRRGRRATSRSSPSTAASCRASSSRSSIAASRRRCRCSPASTAARSARCASSRRRRPPTRRPMRRRSASATRDLADAFLKLYPSSDLPESMLATTRDALYGWTAERLACKQTAAGVPSFLYLLRSRLSGGGREGPARLPRQRDSLCLRHRRQDAAGLAASAGDAVESAALSDAMLELLGLVRARRRAERRGPAGLAGLRHRARLHGLRGRAAAEERICCPACTSSTSRSCAAAAPRAASRGTGMSASPRRRCPPRRAMPMIDGAMQSYRADARQVPGARREVASARRGGDGARGRRASIAIGYAELDRRSRKVSAGARAASACAPAIASRRWRGTRRRMSRSGTPSWAWARCATRSIRA